MQRVEMKSLDNAIQVLKVNSHPRLARLRKDYKNWEAPDDDILESLLEQYPAGTAAARIIRGLIMELDHLRRTRFPESHR